MPRACHIRRVLAYENVIRSASRSPAARGGLGAGASHFSSQSQSLAWAGRLCAGKLRASGEEEFIAGHVLGGLPGLPEVFHDFRTSPQNIANLRDCCAKSAQNNSKHRRATFHTLHDASHVDCRKLQVVRCGETSCARWVAGDNLSAAHYEAIRYNRRWVLLMAVRHMVLFFAGDNYWSKCQ